MHSWLVPMKEPPLITEGSFVVLPHPTFTPFLQPGALVLKGS